MLDNIYGSGVDPDSFESVNSDPEVKMKGKAVKSQENIFLNLKIKIFLLFKDVLDSIW